MNFSQNNTQLMLVGKAVLGTAAATINNLADGEVRIFTPGGALIAEAGAAGAFKIAVGRANDVPLVSAVISAETTTKITKADYTAGTVKVDHVGSNGVNGSIEVNNNATYIANISIKEGIETNHQAVYMKDMVYKSDGDANQAEITLGLAASGYANFTREADKMITFAAIVENAGAAIGTGLGDITFNPGSKTVFADISQIHQTNSFPTYFKAFAVFIVTVA